MRIDSVKKGLKVLIDGSIQIIPILRDTKFICKYYQNGLYAELTNK